ncbi:unnamed protein product [Sphagnum compactum]
MSLHFLRQSAATRLMNLMSPQNLLCKKNSQKLHHHHHHPLCKLFFLASVVVEPRRTVVWQKRRSGNPANSSSNRSCKANKGSEEGEDVGVVGRTQEHDKKKLSCCCYAGGDGWREEEKEEEETQFEEQLQNVEESAQDDDDNDDAWDVVVEDEDVQLLAKFRTMYNHVQVLEVARRAQHPLAGARILLLDKPGNIQSVYFPQKVLTDSYYDVFATLPPLLPEGGPVGILGLGAGTAARILRHFWPAMDIHGWELDPAVIMVARQFFNLSELEEGKELCLTSGKLHVHIGDALNLCNITIPGGFAGLIVDLFAGGAVIPALQQIETWQQLGEKLSPGGRIMVNCGGSCVEAEAGQNVRDGRITMEETLVAMAMAFSGNKVCRKNLGGSGNNTIALTGPTPDLDVWKQALPECLREGATGWVPVFPDS